MSGRTSSTRAQALRRAQQVKQQRDARRLARERQVEAALVDFFEHTQRAATLREQAQARAAKLLTDAETAAREFDALAATAVRTLDELGETRSSIVELTGLSPAEIRAAVNQSNV